ncbi:MAG: hypothetical protein FWG03_08950 [Clostridiales bacterium]|nr:hypothetical protein [Clostridiales bacterium]
MVTSTAKTQKTEKTAKTAKTVKTAKTAKTRSIVFTAAFIAMLILPLAFVDPEGGKISEPEKRVLAARPPASELREDPVRFKRHFDGWFADNTGFRGPMIRLYKQLDRLETQGQYIDGQYVYLIGREGHHFFAGYEGFLITKYQGVPMLEGSKLERFSGSIEEIRLYLEGRDTPFIVMFCTDKETVYPEYYPESIIKGPDPIYMDFVTDYLLENTDADLFSTKECLMAEKENYLVYNKSEGDVGHWNEIGAFFVYRELMAHVGAYLPETEPLTLSDIDISYGADGNPVVSLKQPPAFHQLDASFFDGATLERPFTWENIAFENSDESLPTILIMCDSFGETLCKTVPQQFGKTILIHYTNMGNFKEYCDLYEPDIVVLEIAERQLAWAPGHLSIDQ